MQKLPSESLQSMEIPPGWPSYGPWTNENAELVPSFIVCFLLFSPIQGYGGGGVGGAYVSHHWTRGRETLWPGPLSHSLKYCSDRFCNHQTLTHISWSTIIKSSHFIQVKRNLKVQPHSGSAWLWPGTLDISGKSHKLWPTKATFPPPFCLWCWVEHVSIMKYLKKDWDLNCQYINSAWVWTEMDGNSSLCADV